MIRNSILLILVAGVGIILWQELSVFQSPEKLNDVAGYYAKNGHAETGDANIVTSVVVTYRGFDTLGEVTILFITATIIGFLLKGKQAKEAWKRPDSEFLITASQVLIPVIFLVGVYIFVNGHLTPGGGFQGGAVIASANILWLSALKNSKINHNLLEFAESFSGFGFVLLGVLGIFMAGGFLDNKIFSLGTFGTLFSAGAIPVIYSLIGLKVGSELSKIVIDLNQTQEDAE